MNPERAESSSAQAGYARTVDDGRLPQPSRSAPHTTG